MDNRRVIGYKMECPECCGMFNELAQMPKALPCGHTFCLKCLETVDRCFADKKEFTLLPCELPDNHNIRAMLRSNVNTSGSYIHVWCVSCNKPAEENCVDEKHKTASRKHVLFQQLLEKLNITENPLHPKNCQKFVDSLTEVEVAEAMQMLKGHVSPTNILLRGGSTRWLAELPKGCGENDNDDAKVLRSILFMLKHKGMVPQEVIMLPKEEKPIEIPKVDPECVLDMNNLTTSKDQTSHSAEKKELLSANRLLKIRRLIGLYCDRDKKWTAQLLESLAPVLEEVHLYNFYLEHLLPLFSMPQLRWLVLEDTRIPKKTIFELPTTLQHQSKVEFLWVNVFNRKYDDEICRHLVRLYQASVKILFVSLPSYHKDAISYFTDLEMPNLKLLMYSCSYCGSDNCRDIMVGLRKRFPGIKIVCMLCERTDKFDE